MSETKTIQLFDALDEATGVLQEKMSETYLDSLGMSMELLHFGDVDEEMPQDVKATATAILNGINTADFTKEEIRRSIQLAILKGMQKSTQHQHAITPDAIALFMGYLAEKLYPQQGNIRIFDPVSGTGNLLLTVMNHLKQQETAFASEIDTTLLRISLMYANLLSSEVEFFHQDSLRPFLLDPVDLVVADLPVGYYPDDVQASQYELQAAEGHSFAHYLFIEQSLHYTKPGGFLILLIPETLFSGEESNALHTFFQKHAHIIGVLQLNETTFKSKQNKKSILILQKKSDDTEDMKQPLLAMLPSFKDTEAMADIMKQINEWFKEAQL